ncbi:FHA domain-containing protein, partial [Salmonella enterica subsp. enterica serovar Istanbul]|nr:FHA domain-containing protein [Salmonella enterica subsp. enterica serovar Istanbul]
HCRVLSIGGRVIIEDLGSANGTLVNGEMIQHQELKEGDKIRLGANTMLKFTYQDKLDETFQQQMYDAALRDGLTKSYNKKFFIDRLETEFA